MPSFAIRPFGCTLGASAVPNCSNAFMRRYIQQKPSAYTTEAVCFELDVGRSLRADTINPRSLRWATVVSVSAEQLSVLPYNQLGPGEQSVLAYAYSEKVHIVGLDDLEARTFATSLGIRMIGTLGVLIRAKQSGFIAAVHPLLDELTEQGFHISSSLFDYVLQQVNEG